MSAKRLLQTVLLLALLAGTSLSLFAQDDGNSYEALWQRYEKHRHGNWTEALTISDTVALYAERDHDAYQLFRARYSRAFLCRLTALYTIPQAVLFLDSVMRRNEAAAWNDPDSSAYQSLYLYLIGTFLDSWGNEQHLFSTVLDSWGYQQPRTSPIGYADLRRMKEWSQEDCRNASAAYIQRVFDDFPDTVHRPAQEWLFMASVSSDYLSFQPTLFDILVHDRHEKKYYDDESQITLLIDKAIRRHPLPHDRLIILDYELYRLESQYDLAESPADSSIFWQQLAELEAKYGPDEAFDYTRGHTYYQLTSHIPQLTDYHEKAVDYFRLVLLNGQCPYYRERARKHLDWLTSPDIRMHFSTHCHSPNEKIRIPLEYTNIDTLYVSVYKEKIHSWVFYYDDFYGELYRNIVSDKEMATPGEPFRTERFILPTPCKYETYTTELWLDTLPAGNYVLFFHRQPVPDSAHTVMTAQLTVSRLFISQWKIGGRLQLAVNDRKTGQPISGLRVWKDLWLFYYTNRFGEVHFPRQGLFHRIPMTLYDHGEPFDCYLDHYYEYGGSSKWDGRVHRASFNTRQLKLFTDRTLFRPEQTLQFKMVAVRHGRAWKNCPLTVKLIDIKNKSIVDSLQLTTSQYGSVAGSFTLPNKVGNYSLWCGVSRGKHVKWSSERVFIEIAAYKLPTFKVEFVKDSSKSSTCPGDTLTVRGTVLSLNGVPLQDIPVNLSFQIHSIHHTRTVTTDRHGRFVYRYAVPSSLMTRGRIQIVATASDANGETHEQKTSIELNQKPLHIDIQGDDKVDAALVDTMVWTVMLKNIEDISQTDPLQITVQRLQSPPSYHERMFHYPPTHYEPLYSDSLYAAHFPLFTPDVSEPDFNIWPVIDTVWQTTRSFSPDSLLKINISNWSTGHYRLIALVKDPKGDTVSATRFITLNRSDSTDFPIYKPLNAKIVSIPNQRGGIAEIVVGTALENAVLICDVYQGTRVIATKKLLMTREQRRFRVRTRRTGSPDIAISAHIVQNGQLYSEQDMQIIRRQEVMMRQIKYLEKRKLQMNLLHFNDLAEPGQKEHWELELRNVNDSVVRHDAELLAWMIDVGLYSLKMETPYHHMPPACRHYPALPQLSISSVRNVMEGSMPYFRLINRERRYYPSNERASLIWNWVRIYNDYSSGTELNEVVVTYEPPAFSMDMTSEMAHQMRKLGHTVKWNEEEPLLDKSPSSSEKLPNRQDFRIRKRFEETAFFFPQLHPANDGHIRLDFTLPDQYTRWQLFAVGHTLDMRTGVLTAFVDSRKLLMVQSNAPRFFREKDTMDLRAKITNISDQPISGNVTLQFWDTVGHQPLKMILDDDGNAKFDLASGATQEIHFRIAVPEGVSAITYRLLARSDHYGDGEENVLAVLPCRTCVTESCPFIVPARTDTAFVFGRFRDNQSPTLRPLSYTVEFTTNPAWMAVRTLPSLIRYPYECNEQLFAKVFAAAIAQQILEQNPSLADTYAQWSQDTLHRSTDSPLFQNETLKSILLEETPWLNDALDESQQRRETAAVFNADYLEKFLQKNLKKLENNQLKDGGWDWYGAYSFSGFITNHIIAGSCKMQQLGVQSRTLEQMVVKAVVAADTMQSRAYRRHLERLKEHPDLKFMFTETDAQYLYARTAFSADSAWLAQPFVQNLLALAVKDIFKKNYTRQAEIAMVLYRTGNQKLARELVTALRRVAVVSRDKGMYWENPSPRGSYYPWYEASVERHAVIMEAFAEISPDAHELEAMRQWLLMQKHGNSWNNTRASTEAVYALLSSSPSELLAPASSEVLVGGKTLTTNADAPTEAATGYHQRVWTGENIHPDFSDIAVRTDSVHPLIGSCYYQYLEEADKVTAAGAGLHIERRLYHASVDGAPMQPVTAENPAHLGERLVARLVLSSDRDLEYVFVRDPRAAAFEPVNVHERYAVQFGLGRVESPRDASTCFFISSLPKGESVIEYEVFATQTGEFTLGNATVECMYAPDCRAQTAGRRVTVR